MHLFFLASSILVIASQTQLAFASGSTVSPTVDLPYGSFLGVSDKSTGITQYLGIPFAAPPVGSLRFQRPQPPLKQHSLQNATYYRANCPQQGLSVPDGIPLEPSPGESGEDCLHINVIRPSKVSGASKLPVYFWIYGGAFEVGAAADNALDAINLVQRSVALDEPIIFVSFNYRVNAFGFIAGKEVAENGVSNLAIRDQAAALEWTHKYIHLFGGDPSKIVIGGISAGAMSAATHLLKTDRAKPLFRGAFLASGTFLPLAAYTEVTGQRAFNQLVSLTNCNHSRDRLDCLRRVPFDTLMVAVNQTRNMFSYSSVDNDWHPRIDGDVIKENEYGLVRKGQVYDVPLLLGNDDDEGTLFSFSSLNVTTDEEFRGYVQEHLLLSATSDDIDKALELYPSDPELGSPFDTGDENALTSEFKRIAALQGDLIFTSPGRFLRRSLSANKAHKSKIWAYLSKRGKSTPAFGAFHGSDYMAWFGTEDPDEGDMYRVDSLIFFINRLDPNPPKHIDGRVVWPEYSTKQEGALLTFLDPLDITVTTDDFRADAMKLLDSIELARS